MDILPPEPPKPGQLIRQIPTKHEMEHCPICLKKWKTVQLEGRQFFVCQNSYCMIQIWIGDPFLGMYFLLQPEPCPVCTNEKTRVFYRQDGYLKLYCPKCKLIIENVDPEKHQAVIEAEAKKRNTRWLPDTKGKGVE